MSLVVSGGQTIDVTSAVSSAVVDLGGELNVLNGGAAYASLVSGIQAVLAGGTASGTVVSGGYEVVAGGTADGTSVSYSGDQVVASGGVASGTVVSVAMQEISAGGTAIGAVLGDYAQQFVYAGGSAIGTVVRGGGSQVVSSGGIASDTVVDEGNSQFVSAGGTAIGTVLSGMQSGSFYGYASLAIGGGTAIISAADIQGPTILRFYNQGGTLEISGNTMPSVAIGGFDTGGASDGDVIDLAAVPFDPAGSVSLGSGNVLTVSEGGQSYQIAFDPSQDFTGVTFQLSNDGAGGTDIGVPCYAAGTRLATPDGETPVEALQPGDLVLAYLDGTWAPHAVRWVGRLAVELWRHPEPQHAAPVRIRRHAFAPGIPHRDLLVSPDHAMFVDGALIQAQALGNGATIVQELPARITYLHVELERHGLLLAEGLPAESYLDTGNRALFAGETGARPLHPHFASAAAWHGRACAPLLLGGARVAAAHSRLRARAESLGFIGTHDPALAVLADGQGLPYNAGKVRLPAGTREVRLCSRSFVPRWFGTEDGRRLGVAVTAVRLSGRTLPARAFGTGWHAPEPGWRWTDGEAVLMLPPRARPATLAVQTTRAGARYWQDNAGHDAQQRHIGGAAARRSA